MNICDRSSSSSFLLCPPRLGEGTLVSFERDLGLEDSRTLQRFGLQWRPFHRHELALSYFDLNGSLDMTIQGREAFIRVAF